MSREQVSDDAAAAADPVGVLVFDEHEPSRVGLALLLGRQPWVGRCVHAGDRRRATELVRRERPVVAVVDISEVGPFVGLLLEALRAPHPPLRVVFTARCPVPASAPLRRTGAPFLPVGTSATEVLAAVRAAAYDEREAAGGGPVGPSLTSREREVLDLLVTGATNREIAVQLGLGPDSIKKHASSVYRKLGVRNRTEAAQLVARQVRTAP